MVGTAGDFWRADEKRTLDFAKVRNSGVELRLVAVELESGRKRVFNQRGELLDDPGGGQVSLADAVLASASIPVVFPPVRLKGGTYVDGGVREIVPVAAAVGGGASIVFAVNASPLSERVDTMGTASIADIGLRALALSLDEIGDDDVRDATADSYGRRLFLIRPRVNTHEVLDVEPGRISIAMDYGYMEAADVVADLAPVEKAAREALLDDTIGLRLNIWLIEHHANGELPPGIAWDPANPPTLDSAALLKCRSLKRKLATLATDRATNQGGTLPPNADTWWRRFERHRWAPVVPSPWDRYVDSQGNLIPAEAAP